MNTPNTPIGQKNLISPTVQYVGIYTSAAWLRLDTRHSAVEAGCSPSQLSGHIATLDTSEFQIIIMGGGLGWGVPLGAIRSLWSLRSQSLLCCHWSCVAVITLHCVCTAPAPLVCPYTDLGPAPCPRCPPWRGCWCGCESVRV